MRSKVAKSVVIISAASLLVYILVSLSTSQVFKEVNIVLANTFAVEIQAIADNKDITANGNLETATLYVFDENSNFMTQIHLDQEAVMLRKATQFEFPEREKLTIIAFAGSSESIDEEILSKGNDFICDLQKNINNVSDLNVSRSDNIYAGYITAESSQGKEDRINVVQVKKNNNTITDYIQRTVGDTLNRENVLFCVNHADLMSMNNSLNRNLPNQKIITQNSVSISLFELNNELPPI